ncbi:MAG: transposase, partial [Victivallales bacterium]|nr:transposase [Victivallales bacterium]
SPLVLFCFQGRLIKQVGELITFFCQFKCLLALAPFAILQKIRYTDSYLPRIAFHRWIKFAEETRIPELRTMAKTLRDKIEGIISFWTFRHISNASMEGFNNKIRWLIKQAYGFRDSEYFKLKIYQLPEISSIKEL